MDDNHINVWYDNIQTIQLVNAEIATLQTKLRHVDIHNHWLREVEAQGQIKVNYTPTHDMIVDGLMKTLIGKTFEAFKDQVGLKDMTITMKERELLEITKEDLECLEASFFGGESTVHGSASCS
jgi:hypothetical protein